MKILFTHSYFLNFDSKQLLAASPYPPLGTIYAASYLRSHGYDVYLHDIQFATSPDEIIKSFEEIKPDLFVIYDDGFNYLTKMCLTNMREAAFRMQQLAHSYNCKVIVSSSDSTDHAMDYLKNGADFIIRGEAEQTLLELTNVISGKNSIDYKLIDGISFLHNNELIITNARAVLKDLDQLPLPAWDLIQIEPYRKMWMDKHGYFSINMVSTRGCPYKCNWCAKPIYGNRYNTHSAEKVVEQIVQLQKKFKFTHIWFADDIFGLKPGWLKAFAEEIKKNKIQIKYKIQSRADLLLEEDNISYLAKSGCDMVWMGAESGSQKILDAMDKGTKVEQIAEATKKLKKFGIKTAFFLQFGYPGETIEDIKLTIDMVNKLLPYDIGISVSYPLPGTKFYESVKEELKSKSNWSDSDDLALMFKNTYKPEFYRQLHRLIHKSYRKNQSLNMLSSLLKGRFDEVNFKRVLAYPYYHFGAIKEKNKLKSIEKDVARSL
jgi:radical SAM superfamily enzyme YgiQ (UPF0313 family)